MATETNVIKNLLKQADRHPETHTTGKPKTKTGIANALPA
jgi:hypothetical protein